MHVFATLHFYIFLYTIDFYELKAGKKERFGRKVMFDDSAGSSVAKRLFIAMMVFDVVIR